MSALPGSGAALSDRLSMGLLVLTAVSGIVDAVSFLGLGHVFTANMTGNVAFLAFAAVGAPDISVASSIHLAGRIPERRGARRVPLPVSWTREGDIKIAPPPSIVDPNVTERSCFSSHAAIAAVRAATGV
jgi:Protein of unknown function (DUF1275)